MRTASVLVFTVLWVIAADADTDTKVTAADFFNGNIDTVLKELSNIDQSSNVLVKNLRDLIEKHSGSFDQDKKLIQDAVTKGMEMEKKIQNISNTLKTSNMPLPTELQSGLEEIGKRSATELNKLKGLENAKELDEMQKEYKNKYAVVRGKMEELAKWGMALRKGENTQSSGTQAKHNANSEEFKTKSIEFITSMTSFLLIAEKDSKKVSDKHKIASNALSNMRNDLIKIEKMEYHLLLSQREHFTTDAASSIGSSPAQVVFAIMFGILFSHFSNI